MSQRKAWIIVLAIALVSGVLRVVVVPQLRASRLHARSLPGFSVALPDGKVARDDRGYARGTFLISLEQPHLVVGAAWQPDDGTELSSAELEAMAQVFANGFGKVPKGKANAVSVDGADGKPLASIHLDTGDQMWATMAPCGARSVVLLTIAARGAERLHRAVVRSFKCMPDAAEEAAIRGSGSPLVLDLPGWRATEQTSTFLQLTNDKGMVMLQNVPANIENAELAQVFAPIMKTQGLTMSFEAPRDGRVAFALKTRDANVVGWARVFHCPAASEAMLAFADSDEGAQSLWQRIGQSRCVKAGEAAQTWPGSAKQ